MIERRFVSGFLFDKITSLCYISNKGNILLTKKGGAFVEFCTTTAQADAAGPDYEI